MNREVINPQELPAVNSTYSQAIKANGMIFVAGQIGLGPATGKLVSSDIAEQARQAIENTAMILKAAGSSLANVVSTTLYLTEFDQLGRVNTRCRRRILSASRTGEAFLRRERALRRRQIRDPGHCRISGRNLPRDHSGLKVRLFPTLLIPDIDALPDECEMFRIGHGGPGLGATSSQELCAFS